MSNGYLNQKLQCPSVAQEYKTMQAPRPQSPVQNAASVWGSWDELQTDFERQGAASGIF